MVLHALHLCSGYGGFELGLRLAGVDCRTVAHVERDAYAAAVLVERMGQARLDQAPVWSDLATFDGHPWRGRVDIVTAGFPCQPFSAAGKRRGVDDDRWLWPEIARIISEVGPRWVFLENVPGVIKHGLAYVLSDLAQLGFDAEWGLLAASAVGAPHKRERFWLVAQHRDAAVAHDNNDGCTQVGREPERCSEPRDDLDGSSGADVGHAGSTRRPEITRGTHGDEGRDARWAEDAADEPDRAGEDVAEPRSHSGQAPKHSGSREVAARVRPEPGRQRPAVAHATGERQREPHFTSSPITWGDARADIGRSGFPPRPDDIDGWAEWIAAGGPEPSVRRSTDGPPVGLADALHLGGNGLVPQCAAEAWLQLTARLNVPIDD